MMNKDFEEKFESILERYNLPKGANWKPLKRKVELAEYNMPMKEEVGQGVVFMDAEALVRLIMLLQSSKAVEMKGESGSVRIEESNLLKYLILSLHKLLQLKWRFDNPTNEEKKAGKHKLLAKGSDEWVEVGIKGALDGEESCFIQPYTQEELQKLLELSIGLKNYKKIRQGRGKNIAFLGDKVAEMLATIPNEVKESVSKTDLLNFVGDIMEQAGFLKDVKGWNNLAKDFELAEKKNYKIGEIKKRRQKMLANWLKSARETYCKAELAQCKECKEFGVCVVTRRLEYYSI